MWPRSPKAGSPRRWTPAVAAGIAGAADVALAQAAGTDNGPIEAARPALALTKRPAAAGLTVDASTGFIAGTLPAVLGNTLAPDMSWPIAICIGSIANC
ncbi:hypothetical protein, partial [Mycobacterium montefiorense]|uniref:hypothetical protein n=2 Tax=Mycobacterium montefiorense TaxID=154654 RepID=UPI0021C3C92B